MEVRRRILETAAAAIAPARSTGLNGFETVAPVMSSDMLKKIGLIPLVLTLQPSNERGNTFEKIVSRRVHSLLPFSLTKCLVTASRHPHITLDLRS